MFFPEISTVFSILKLKLSASWTKLSVWRARSQRKQKFSPEGQYVISSTFPSAATKEFFPLARLSFFISSPLTSSAISSFDRRESVSCSTCRSTLFASISPALDTELPNSASFSSSSSPGSFFSLPN